MEYFVPRVQLYILQKLRERNVIDERRHAAPNINFYLYFLQKEERRHAPRHKV